MLEHERGETGGANGLRMAVVVLAVVALAVAACGRRDGRHATAQPTSLAGGAGGVHPAGTLDEELVSGGMTRRYRLHVPPSYQAGVAMPLVLNLHGYGSNARQQEILSGMSDKADAAGFIVAYPQGEGDRQAWHIGPGQQGQADVTFIRDLIGHLRTVLDIDPARVYATGMSNGGGMVNRLGCDLADLIAAIAPVSGDYQFYHDCSPARAMPVAAFHGTDDRLVPYEGNNRAGLPPVRDWAAAWSARDGCAASPSVTYQQGEVTGETWDGCRDGAVVVLYTVMGRGHTWPGSPLVELGGRATTEISATDTMWDFFVAHPKS